MPSATACARVLTPKVSWMSWTSVLTVRSESWRLLAIVRVSAPPARSFRTSILRGSMTSPFSRLRVGDSTCSPAAAARTLATSSSAVRPSWGSVAFTFGDE